VVDGRTGLVVRRPGDPRAAADALARLLDDVELRRDLGAAARQRVVTELSYDLLASRLRTALDSVGS
jgi:glycosyltransferase involved in cell wall biosynthesis